MSLDSIQLWKVLRLLGMNESARRSALKSDARQTANKIKGVQSQAMDFYGPIWSDIKVHVYGAGHLPQMTGDRITSNPRRKKIYEQISGGFMLYWQAKRRSFNGPIRSVAPLGGNIKIDNSVIKIENLLSFDTASDAPLHLYPYLYCEPELSTQNTQLGLWALKSVLDVRARGRLGILEVVRSTEHLLPLTTDNDQCASLFYSRFREMHLEWSRYVTEYLDRAA